LQRDSENEYPQSSGLSEYKAYPKHYSQIDYAQ